MLAAEKSELPQELPARPGWRSAGWPAGGISWATDMRRKSQRKHPAEQSVNREWEVPRGFHNLFASMEVAGKFIISNAAHYAAACRSDRPLREALGQTGLSMERIISLLRNA
jgi:hypothetical protein